MAYDNTVTIVGNITRDPELRFTPGGMAVTTFSVAWNRRKQDGDDDVSFFDVTCFRQLAENVAESVTKGDRVIIFGAMTQRSWETEDRQRRSKVEIIADDVAPSMKWATVAVTKNPRSGGGAAASYAGSASNGAGANATPPDYDEEPF